MDRINTLLYIDPGCRIDFGHFMRMGQAIGQEAQRREIAYRHFVSNDVPSETAHELGLIPRFDFIAGLEWTDDPAAALMDFLNKTDQILTEESSRPDHGDLDILMYTAHPLHLPIIAYLLSKYGRKEVEISAYACLFYLDTGFCRGLKSDSYIALLAQASELVELFDPEQKLRICVDSDRTKRAYGPYFEREIELLPLPLSDEPARVSKRQERQRIAIGYVGDRTKRAGYDLVYHAYKQLSRAACFEKVEFRVKHAPRDQQVEIFEQFHAESENISHVDKFLTDQEYLEFIAGCDVLLLPYQSERYPTQTSGILVDALCEQKIVVTPENTWMADQLKKYGAGETFVSGDADSLARAIETVIDDFEDLRQERGRNILEFRELHSAQNLFDSLAALDFAGRAVAKSEDVADRCGAEITESVLHRSLSLILDLQEMDDEIRKRDRSIVDKRAEIDTKSRRIKSLEREIERAKQNLAAMENSRSWKITAPLRSAENSTLHRG